MINIINNSCFINIPNIYVISDIQGDLDLLIILLRDCAKVIKTNNEIPNFWREMAKQKIPEISAFYNNNFEDCYNIGKQHNYDCLFDFEWCGNSSWIVINGDIIDNNSHDTISDYNDPNKVQNEIENVELKIMLFLKVLTSLAKQKNGNIIKIIGNHDNYSLGNLDEPFISNFGRSQKYNNIKRIELFLRYHQLFNNDNNMKHIIVKINNFIFIHGSINKDIIIKIQDKYNQTLENIIDKINEIYNNYINNKNKEDLTDDIIKIFNLRDLSPWDVNINKEWCRNLDLIIQLLCLKNPDYINKLLLVVGHSPQYHFYQDDNKINFINSSHSKIIRKGNVHYISGPIKYTSAYKELCMDTNDFLQECEIYKTECISYILKMKFDVKFKNVPIVFGITCSCQFEDDQNLAKVYRIDSGAAKIYDIDKMNTEAMKILESNKINKKIIGEIILYMYRYYVSRLPQVLHISTESSKVSTIIIRSTLKNSFLNMYRNNVFPFRLKDIKYKSFINTIVDIIDNNISK